MYTSNQDPSAPRQLAPGVYGLSNCLLDSPWQKVQRGKAAFTDIVSSPDSNLTDKLFKLLSDDTRFGTVNQKHLPLCEGEPSHVATGLIQLFLILTTLRSA